MRSVNTKPKTIDEYLAGVNADQRVALETLRRTIRAVAPKAEEYISYGLAAFRLEGRPLVAFGASANHCAFYPMNSTTVEAFKEQLKRFETSKGTIRFPADKLLPSSLVRKMVKARIAESTGNIRQGTDSTKPVRKPAKGAASNDVQSVLTVLKRLSNPRIREEMSSRCADGRLKNGVFKEHYKDGTLACIGKFLNGEKVGVWKYYLRNGQLRAMGKFAGGKMTGAWKWYRENGKLMQTGSFDAEKKTGLWKRYHPNGALYDEGEFTNDKKVGEWRAYDAKGKLRKTTQHEAK